MKKMILQPKGELSHAQWERARMLMPVVACEIVIFNSKKEILLTWRKDEYYKGWHNPGGLLRMRESLENRIQVVLHTELGVRLKSFKFLDFYNYTDDPRGHTVGLIFLCSTSGKPKTGTFFKKIPQGTLIHQKPYLQKAFRQFKKK